MGNEVRVKYQLIPRDGMPEGSHLGSEFHVYDGSEAWERSSMSFNPSENEDVTSIKALTAGLMECVAGLRDRAIEEQRSGRARCFSTAMTHLEAAQMFAVKGLFNNEPEDP